MSTEQPASGPPSVSGDEPVGTDGDERLDDQSDERADEVEVDDVIDPAAVRRAPRYKAFFWTGAIVGIVLGLVLGAVVLSTPGAGGLMKPGVYLTVVVLGTTTFTVLLAGFLAVMADRRSLRSRDR
ncbi:hypothetical protein [Paraoerskovia marina]|uniref:hypothetical protein n=1 Tax=Paraoerskovia marina TaxID=545619 RepID=UPI0004923772|nr:hypothetical protein [Paraoerskovia marina]